MHAKFTIKFSLDGKKREKNSVKRPTLFTANETLNLMKWDNKFGKTINKETLYEWVSVKFLVTLLLRIYI